MFEKSTCWWANIRDKFIRYNSCIYVYPKTICLLVCKASELRDILSTNYVSPHPQGSRPQSKLKHVQKLCALNWKTLTLFLDHVLDSYRLDTIEKLWTSEALILRFQNHNSFVIQISGDWKILVFSQRTYNFQNLTNKSLAIPDHECVNNISNLLFWV